VSNQALYGSEGPGGGGGGGGGGWRGGGWGAGGGGGGVGGGGTGLVAPVSNSASALVCGQRNLLSRQIALRGVEEES